LIERRVGHGCGDQAIDMTTLQWFEANMAAAQDNVFSRHISP
jgi:hypothetical protein